jgi:N-acetyl-gamma-glutamyl-phosphate reductase
MPAMALRVAIVGPTSYTGLFLVRLLLRHPQARIAYLATQRDELPSLAQEFPELAGRCELPGRPIDPDAIAREADLAFLCLPHLVSMKHAPSLLDAGLRVIDLSADYRLRDAELYERTYGHAHEDPQNLGVAAYGLPEFFRAQVAEATLVANPGCYPTAAALAIAPLLQRSLVKPQGIVVNAASGVTGAGRSPKPNLHFPEVNEGFVPYGVGEHRHQPEIGQTLSLVRGLPTEVLFVPHLLPISQGILETIYLDPIDDEVSQEDLYEAYHEAYRGEPFVRVRREPPNVRHVVNTNFCDLAARLTGPESARKVVAMAAIDNMVKGASGQAVQNMNLMYGIGETLGLL